MSSKVHKKAYDQAADAFKTAEAEVVRLAKRSEDIAQRLLQAKLVHAQFDTEIDQFAIGDGAIDEQIAQHAGKIRELSAKRLEAEATITLLERAAEAARTGHIEAKVQLVLAEEAARQSQAAYFASLDRELVDDFVRTNRTALLRILQVVNADGFHDDYGRTRNIGTARMGLICRLDNLLETVIAEAAARMTDGESEAASAVVGESQRGDPPYMPLQSAQITPAERGRLNDHGGIGRGATHAKLVQMLSQDDTPVVHSEPLNRYHADSERRRHNDYAEELRQTLKTLQAEHDKGNGRDRASYVANSLGGYSVDEAIEKVRAELEVREGYVANWTKLLEADDAARAGA